MSNVQPITPRVREVEAPVSDHGHARNPGLAFDADAIDSLKVYRSAAERCIATLPGRRTVKKEWQAAWLLKAVQGIDLTTLSGDDTPGRVHRLCAKAQRPVREDLLEAMGVGDLNITTGAVCVYHNMVETAVRDLEGTNIPVAAVSTGFPAGLSPLPLRIKEIEASVAAGTKEIDIVFDRGLILGGHYRAVGGGGGAGRGAGGPARGGAGGGAGGRGAL